MSKKISRRTVRVASAGALCLTLAFGTAGVAMAGQHSQSRDHSSFTHHDQGQSSNFAFGVVSALATNSITLKDRQGNTTSYTTTSATTYFEGKTAGAVTDLAVNEEVVLALTSSTPQTVTKVEIRLDRVAGAVTGVSGDTITIAGHHGSTINVVVGNTTTYTSGGATSSLAAVVTGAVICAVGLPGATSGTLDASTVIILPSVANHQDGGSGHANSGTSEAHNHGGGRGRGRH